jgi:hypothetical protein
MAGTSRASCTGFLVSEVFEINKLDPAHKEKGQMTAISNSHIQVAEHLILPGIPCRQLDDSLMTRYHLPYDLRSHLLLEGLITPIRYSSILMKASRNSSRARIEVSIVSEHSAYKDATG